MRIAISGTHCCGKSTLVEDFLAVHPEYAHEPEPYEWLEELGEAMAEEPAAADFLRQLELSVERLRTYGHGANVIAERCPIDFLAYLLAIGATDMAEDAMALAVSGMRHIDLLVVVSPEGVAAPESEDLALREAMHERLLDLIADDGSVRIIDVRGARHARLATLERATRS